MLTSFHFTFRSAGFDTFQSSLSNIEEIIGKRICTLPQIEEHLILKTCNRFEVYIVSDDCATVRRELESAIGMILPYESKNAPWFILSNEESVSHLFRVVSGLESLVIGEDQIQGQVKNAYIEFKKEGHAGKTLSKLFEKALYTGKRVRTETSLNNGSVSVASIAVEYAEKEFDSLKNTVVSIYGAGDMAIAVAKNLAGKGLETLFVSSRTYDRAKKLADEIGGRAVSVTFIQDIIAKSDIFVVATSAPHVLIFKDRIEAAMKDRNRKLVILDISMPKNVDDSVSEIENVKLIAMDGIESAADENRKQRTSAISAAEGIVSAEFEDYCAEERGRYVNEIIRGVNLKIAAIKEEELRKAKTRIAHSNDIDSVLEDLSDALVSKIMAEPYQKLKNKTADGNDRTCSAIAELFGVRNNELS